MFQFDKFCTVSYKLDVSLMASQTPPTVFVIELTARHTELIKADICDLMEDRQCDMSL
jgi:hypothetical protein